MPKSKPLVLIRKNNNGDKKREYTAKDTKRGITLISIKKTEKNTNAVEIPDILMCHKSSSLFLFLKKFLRLYIPETAAFLK